MAKDISEIHTILQQLGVSADSGFAMMCYYGFTSCAEATAFMLDCPISYDCFYSEVDQEIIIQSPMYKPQWQHNLLGQATVAEKPSIAELRTVFKAWREYIRRYQQ